MKRCPQCGITYDDTQAFCSEDGLRLVTVSEADSPWNPPPTVAFPNPASPIVSPAAIKPIETAPTIQSPAAPHEKSRLPLILGGIGALFVVGVLAIGAIAAFVYYRYGDVLTAYDSHTPNANQSPDSDEKKSDVRNGEKIVSLSAEDMSALANDSAPETRQRLANSADARKQTARNIAKIFAVAEEAKAVGIAERSDVKRKLEFRRLQTIAHNFLSDQQRANGKTVEQIATPAEVESFLKEPGQQQNYEQLIADWRNENPEKNQKPTPQQMEEGKKSWAQILVAARKAIQEGFDKKNLVQLQIKIQQARDLTQIYTNENKSRFEPTEQEIGARLDKIRSKAKEVLDRARSGEDFAALAKQYSDDAGSRDKGGLHENVKKGQFSKEFENAALALEPGEISGVVESSFGYHIIKLESKGKNAYTVREILISGTEQSRDTSYLGKTFRERVSDAVTDEKLAPIFDKHRDRIEVAEDFAVTPPSASELKDNK